jgi:disulfide bond formation protein DsbB
MTTIGSALEPRRLLPLLALIAALTLASAFVMEHLGGLAPCPLCIWQRWPWAAAVPLALLPWPRLGLALVGLVLLGGAGLAFYHVAVEQGWVALPAGCVGLGEARSLEEMRAMLTGAGRPACDQVAFTFLGLSIAAWNGLWSLMVAMLAAAALWRAGPPRASRSVQAAADSGAAKK